MDAAQKKYGIKDKELLAVIKSVEHFRRYLLGKEFILKTDHKALLYLTEAKNPTSRLLRWALKLQEYHFEVEYVEGDANGAYFLSRYCKGEVKEESVMQVEDSMKDCILKEYHEIGEHASKNNMKFLLHEKYYRNKMNKDINEFVDSCEICAKAGEERQNTKNRVLIADNEKQLW